MEKARKMRQNEAKSMLLGFTPKRWSRFYSKKRQFINANKTNNEIKTPQERFTGRATPEAITQMIYNKTIIMKALETGDSQRERTEN